MRAKQDWDTRLIQMLHNCEAGEKSVITVYARPYEVLDPADGAEVRLMEGPPLAMVLHEWRDDGMPAWRGRPIDQNSERLTRPYETALASGNFAFSWGKLLEECGHSAEYDNVFSWEEIWMAYKYWSAGYTLYAPNETVMHHNWDRTYRPVFKDE